MNIVFIFLVALGLQAQDEMSSSGDEIVYEEGGAQRAPGEYSNQMICASKIKKSSKIFTFKVAGTNTALIHVDQDTLYMVDEDRRTSICRTSFSIPEEGFYTLDLEDVQLAMSQDSIQPLRGGLYPLRTAGTVGVRCNMVRDDPESESGYTPDDIIGRFESELTSALNQDTRLSNECKRLRVPASLIPYSQKSLWQKIKSYFGFEE